MVPVVCFVVGSVYVLHLEALPPWWLLIAAALLAVWQARSTPLVSCFIIGVLLAAFHVQQVLGSRIADQWLNREVVVVGTVIGLPDRNSQRLRFQFRAEQLQDSESTTTQSVDALLRLSWYRNTTELTAGQRWRFTVKLRAPNGFMNPGGFDFEKWLFQHRIVATGYVRGTDPPRFIGVKHSPMHWLQQGRMWLRQRLVLATENSRYQGLILALSIGDRSGIDPLQWQRFIDTGTNHLLAISGLHISLVGAFAALIATFVWGRSGVVRKRFPRKPFSLCIAASGAFSYAGLAGFSVPTQRALLMFGTLAVLSIVARHQPRHGALAMALLVVCMINPLVVLSAGFWMSFAAVAILFVVFSFIPSSKNGSGGVVLSRANLWIVVRGHFLITIGMYPLSLLFFGQVSMVAPLANFLAVPVVGMGLTPLIFIASLAAIFHPAVASIILMPVDWVLLGVDWFLRLLAHWDYALVQLGGVNANLVFLSGVIAVLWLLPIQMRLRWVGALLAVPFFFSAVRAPAIGSYSVAFLDVGQGTAVVVQTTHHTLVYDAGPQFSANFNAADAVILPYLRSGNVRTVERLIVSHADRDHMGGALELTQGIRVDDVWVSEPADELPGARFCRAGMAWRWDDVSFQILHPASGDTGSENDRSCVLLISTDAGKDTLLAGDVEAHGERLLLQRGLPRLELLLAPHHGSKTSSTVQFVEATRPRFVVHSAGYQNRFGFPHDEVVQRYHHARQYETASSGATVFVVSDKHETLVSEYRKDNRQLWSRPL